MDRYYLDGLYPSENGPVWCMITFRNTENAVEKLMECAKNLVATGYAVDDTKLEVAPYCYKEEDTARIMDLRIRKDNTPQWFDCYSN